MQYAKSSVLLGLLLAAITVSVTSADGPWTALIPFRRVEADPKKSYLLAEEHGPWLILAASFAGASGEKQAHDLALELRSRHKLPAYIHKQTYDYTQSFHVADRRTPMGDPAQMRYANNSRFDGFAVLVGNFRSVEEAELEKTLDRIKELRPECMSKPRAGDANTHLNGHEPFAGLLQVKRRISGGAAKHKGPLAAAFVTRNPLLPEELFAPNGVDDFVARLNSGVEHSLLKNRGKFTVRVATFRGNTTINQREIREIESRDKVTNKLEVAADNAHRLTVALRDRGVEAYEFHDRTESIVTIGSFDTDGTPLGNGTIEINPEIYKIMEQYRALPREIPGKHIVGFQPRSLAGVTFDVDPRPMEVPRRSVAADYSRRRAE
jgi:hypothetical protein